MSWEPCFEVELGLEKMERQEIAEEEESGMCQRARAFLPGLSWQITSPPACFKPNFIKVRECSCGIHLP